MPIIRQKRQRDNSVVRMVTTRQWGRRESSQRQIPSLTRGGAAGNHELYVEVRGFPKYVALEQIYNSVKQAIAAEQRLEHLPSSSTEVAIIGNAAIPDDSSSEIGHDESKGYASRSMLSRINESAPNDAKSNSADTMNTAFGHANPPLTPLAFRTRNDAA